MNVTDLSVIDKHEEKLGDPGRGIPPSRANSNFCRVKVTCVDLDALEEVLNFLVSISSVEVGPVVIAEWVKPRKIEFVHHDITILCNLIVVMI